MHAFLHVQKTRAAEERIDFVSSLRVATKASKNEYEKAMQRWARAAEINLTFEDE
jgi:hypothetical protein